MIKVVLNLLKEDKTAYCRCTFKLLVDMFKSSKEYQNCNDENLDITIISTNNFYKKDINKKNISGVKICNNQESSVKSVKLISDSFVDVLLLSIKNAKIDGDTYVEVLTTVFD